jgi:lambda repressor-like predicted transcriptional regulator
VQAHLVDLLGRLSNPPATLESVPEQGVHTAPPPMRTTSNGLKRPSELRGPGDPEEKGRLSNRVQRRLSAAEIEQLIRLHPQGASIDALACRYQVHRTTVIHHLDRAGIARRRVVRKMTDESVALAAARYEQGASLALVASEFGVHQRTLTRELRRAGASIRPRRGWRR